MRITFNYMASLLVSIMTFISLSASAAPMITGTDSMDVTFNANIMKATCVNKVVDYRSGSGMDAPAITEIDFGDIYRSEFKTEGYIKAYTDFAVGTEGCSVNDVIVTIQSVAGCDGIFYKNANITDGVNNLVMKVASDLSNPGIDSYSCGGKPGTSISLYKGNAMQPFKVGLYPAPGKNVDDITSGQFTSPLTFIFTYD